MMDPNRLEQVRQRVEGWAIGSVERNVGMDLLNALDDALERLESAQEYILSLRNDLARCRKVLALTERAGDIGRHSEDPKCPLCKWPEPFHQPNCELAALLREIPQ